MKKREFKLVLIGDSQVGKSRFISALINEDPRLAPQIDLHPPVQLPPEMFSHPECSTIIYDTKCQHHQIPDIVSIADVILLMYAINDDGSNERLKGFWLKELKNKGYTQPIIIVGNKLDLLGQDEDYEYHRIFKVIKQLVKDFSSVEMGIECSSIKQQGTLDVINCAQRSFLYPLAPIYSIVEKALTDKFKKALTRIFRICDKDGDGYWNDNELIKFQRKVFKRQLDPSDISGIKDMIEEELKDNSNKQHITLQGFMALQKRGIELMKIQICWTILRFFKYKDDLTIDESIFNNELIFDQEAGQTVELSEQAQQQLKQIFELRGRTLNRQQIDEIFYPVMYQTNFPQFIQYQPQQEEITLIQWLALWNAFSFFNYKEAYKLMSYIGIEIKLSDAFKEQNKKDSWQSVQKNIDRKVFHIAIITNKNQQKLILEKSFNNISPIITTINHKTYVISLYDENQAELQIKQNRLSNIDFILLDQNCVFDTPQLIPITQFNELESIETQIRRVATLLHQQPFGYSELQIQQLKQQNSLPIFEMSVALTTIVAVSAATYFILNKTSLLKINK